MKDEEIMNGLNENYIDRDISWLLFNQRILTLCFLSNVPYLERLNFLKIADNNLMEFMKVRVSKLQNKIANNDKNLRITGKSAKELYEEIVPLIEGQMRDIEDAKTYLIFDEDNDDRPYIFNVNPLSSQGEPRIEYEVYEKYNEHIRPLINPILITSKPEERVTNIVVEKVYLIIKISKTDISGEAYVVIPLPPDSVMDYVIEYERFDQYINLYTTVDLIIEDVSSRYTNDGWTIENIASFRVCNNCDIPVSEEIDIINEMKKVLRQRLHSDPIMVQYKNMRSLPGDEGTNAYISTQKFVLDICGSTLPLYNITPVVENVNYNKGDMICLGTGTVTSMYDKMCKYESTMKTKHSYPKLQKNLTWANFKDEKSIFDAIKKHDIIMNHPYDDFKIVVNFIKEAAKDKSVVSIRQTLYRVSKNSPIVDALCKAAKNGKTVTVLVELKARFDERHNIIIGRKLEKAGCIVIYGVPTLKTHSKITEVTRIENGKLRKYLHLGTGNYNDKTAQIYSDISLLTCNKKFCDDSSMLFDVITANHRDEQIKTPVFTEFLVSPFNAKNVLIAKITNPAVSHITIKVNGLTDKDIIDALEYAGTELHTKIELYVRGACSLIPTPENGIKIYSVVGQFLEHSRVYYFLKKDGTSEMYCGSADAMPRNMKRRIEILFPIKGKKNIRKVYNMVTKLYPTQLKFDVDPSDYLHPSV